MLDGEARRERLKADKRLIACEKITAGEAAFTVIVDSPVDHGQTSSPAQGVPDRPEAVFQRLSSSAGPIEVIVEKDQWSGTVAELLAGLRDRANRRIVVHVGEARIGDDVDQRMVSLGYRRLSAAEAVYQFDIETYKDTPDWLNPRNWANPELWDKYRW
ncbi:hypothetical protein AUR63_06500 [Guyparkeria sp. XI15]|nr:hypothetical protein AUR63_06500 [Guyparkeria sp. XI15]OAE89478.1 hypothetical protein AWR35_06510 [Guyparkeria sp. WRN-7]